MYVNRLLALAALMLVTLVYPSDAQAQDTKKKKKGEPETPAAATPPAEKKDKMETIEDKVKGHQKMEGLFTFYRDTVTGEIKMEVTADQLEKEFIFFSQLRDGVTEAGAFRGAYGGESIFKIKRFYDRIEFVTINTSHYFDEESALKRAENANISHAVMASEKILARDDKSGRFLISANNLFLKETFRMIKRPSFPGEPPTAFKLGNLSSDKTKVLELKNYPKNVNLAVEYVYDNSSPLNGGSAAVTDARYVSIQVTHSMIAMPENNFQPRFDDPRVGYFTQEVNDMTSTGPTPYRDVINRWYLEKKDPNAAISEPVQPIVWWIENTTPMEWRDVIKEAVLEWNKSFEKAGFRNAIVVNVQPDDATWDAGDIEYNVLRWTSSPNPPFGGYGPSFTNPRTGQILGADIMLEFVYHTNRVKYDNIFTMNANFMEEANNYLHNEDAHKYCSYGTMMQMNNLFGQIALEMAGADDLELEGLKKEAMKELIMHEVGHTLGLNHNMKASQLFTPAELADKNKIDGKALSGSVMDYLLINLTRDKSKQGQYFSPTVGPYDDWAIQFGYTPFKSEAEMKTLLARSTERELTFGNDADDMRSPGKAIDPRVNTGDQSNDQITYSIDRFELVRDLMKGVKAKSLNQGESYQELRQNFMILSGQYWNSGQVISRFVGGVYVDRAMVGQAGGTQPYTPVAYADQKRAMAALSKYVFSPTAWQVNADVYNSIAMQRRGFNFFGGPEDPKIHEMVLGAQRGVLRHLLHQNTTQRLVDSELYGNKYSLSEMMTDLNNAIFSADISGNVSSMRQNLQIEYTRMLAGMVKGSDYGHSVRSMALYNLKQIDRMAVAATGDTSTKAHKEHLRLIVKQTLEGN
mgnify:CR=1 FL=1